ncbi:hypothetical protein HNV10_16495 [Winogradskyella litoriviva]|uniref:Uncharacterized protein n=1 Tax=Winogradskyella litoriviva TaxID=1220182 RepID=A0ABX2E8P6_9FLAO|nr:hypothetical protein [Winogradskyella litoriviva]NRD24855.1 hypothetical protein [Winogradskyella litoriviva]
MKTRLYFGLIAILLAFFGTFVEKTTVPNQQIVIQFSNNAISVEESENAIEAIQTKLQSIGATLIKIGQNDSGQLRITYHSDTDVAHIKNVLFKVENLKVAYNASDESSSKFPKEQNVKGYKLNVSEIKTSTTNTWDFEGTQVTEFNNKTDHSNTLKVHDSGNPIDSELNNHVLNTIVEAYKVVAIVKNNSSYKIPEVRAGPMV